MSRSVNYSGKEYNLSLFNSVEELHTELQPVLQRLANQNKNIPKETVTIDTLDPRQWIKVSVGRPYYIHNSIVPSEYLSDVAFHKAIIKVAFMEQYKAERIPQTTPTFSSFIYGHDKQTNLKARRLDETYVDRFDYFKGCREMKKTGSFPGQYIIRHGGTVKGSTARGTERRASFRDENIEFLRVLMQGPDHVNRVLHCPMTMVPLEGFKIKNNITGDVHKPTCFELHHAKFVDGKSELKNGTDPSKYLNTMSYKNFTAEVIDEFLGMITLSTSAHSMLHKTHYNDDMQGWLGRYKQGNLNSIPYHWKSEAKYGKTTKWLMDNCENYTEDDVTDWPTFNGNNTFTQEQINDMLGKMTKDQAQDALFEFAKLDRDID